MNNQVQDVEAQAPAAGVGRVMRSKKVLGGALALLVAGAVVLGVVLSTGDSSSTAVTTNDVDDNGVFCEGVVLDGVCVAEGSDGMSDDMGSDDMGNDDGSGGMGGEEDMDDDLEYGGM